jgi:sigma-B regulation protein RsbU (phosphoserine phosphatase)
MQFLLDGQVEILDQYLFFQQKLFHVNALSDEAIIEHRKKEEGEFPPFVFFKNTHLVMGKPAQQDEFIIARIPMRIIFNKMDIAKGLHPKSILSIVSEKKQVIASTNPAFENHMLELKPYANGYRFAFKGKAFLAVEKQIEGISESVLLSIPYSVLFSSFLHMQLKLGFLLFLILLVGGIGTYVLVMIFTRPLKQLSNVMHQVGLGNFQVKFRRMLFGFEINTLGIEFNHMIDSLIKKELLEKELYLGHEVQRSLIPEFMPKVPNLEMSGGFFPAKEVGGDFYDILLKNPNEMLFAIADTSGKGIFGCLYSLSFRSILRSFGSIFHHLDEILIHTNQLFCLDTKQTGAFVTSWIGLYQPEKKMLSYASCGHPPAILQKANGDIVLLSSKGVAFGATFFDKVEVRQVPMEIGDMLILYTDGVTEAQNAHGTFFTQQRLIDLVKEKPNKTVQEMLSYILEEVGLFCEGEEQYDDITLFAMKIV